MTRLRGPLKWHGGDYYHLPTILPVLDRVMPDPEVYVEPCVGGGSVFLNRRPVPTEVLGDIDPDVAGLWLALADSQTAGMVAAILNGVAYHSKTFEAAGQRLSEDGWPVGSAARAAAFVIRNRMSRGGMGSAFAWSERTRGGKPGDVNAWETFLADHLPRVLDRLQASTVSVSRHEAAETVRAFDSPRTLHYVDPPYHPEPRTAHDAYAYDFGLSRVERRAMPKADRIAAADRWHRSLIESLRACQGAVVLAGYRCRLYDELLHDWERVDASMPNHSGQGDTKQRRTESLWIKPARKP